MKKLKFFFLFSAFSCSHLIAQEEHPHLNLTTEFAACSFQLDPSLTQDAWHKFTKEAGLVAYFRPMTGADLTGIKKIDISLFSQRTAIDENSEAWNNTFVHPDSAHWLIDGPNLSIPGISIRTGISKKLDAGIMWTTSPGANYSIFGAQLQYNFLNSVKSTWSVSGRTTYSTIYGPKDLTFSIYGIEGIISKNFAWYGNKMGLSPYLDVSAVLSHSHERTDAVNLKDENVIIPQATLGLCAKLYFIRMAAEYNFSATNTFSFRIGGVINLNK